MGRLILFRERNIKMGNIVKFAKPYSFEGTEYTEVDLSGMDKLTIQDMIDIQKTSLPGCGPLPEKMRH